MNDDGTMARLPDLVAFAQRHNLKLGTIADLIALSPPHRAAGASACRRARSSTSPAATGALSSMPTRSSTSEHLALVKGDVCGPEPVLVRMHAVDLLDDMTGGPHWIALHDAMHMIGREGRGVVVLIREHRPTALAERVRLLHGDARGRSASCATTASARRSCSISACENMVLLSNRRRTIVGLEGYGLNIVAQQPIPNIVGEGYTG